MKIKINSDFNEVSGTSQIKSNLTSYINSLGVGTDVILSSLYGQIHAVNGVLEVAELFMKKENSNNIGNISINNWEIAKCRNISVEVVL